MTDPLEGKPDEFNESYSNVHIPDLLKVPGGRGRATGYGDAVKGRRERAPALPHDLRVRYRCRYGQSGCQGVGNTSRMPPVIDSSANVTYHSKPSGTESRPDLLAFGAWRQFHMQGLEPP